MSLTGDPADPSGRGCPLPDAVHDRLRDGGRVLAARHFLGPCGTPTIRRQHDSWSARFVLSTRP